MVTDPINFVYAEGDGTTTDFSYAYNGTVGFDIVDENTVKVAILNPDGTRDLTPSFAVLKDAYNHFSGWIRFSTAPLSGAVIYIYRDTPETQENNWETSSGFSAKSITKTFDKVVRLIQEVFFHAKRRTVQTDEFQEEVLSMLLMSEENDNQLLFVDWTNKKISYTQFTRGQVVISDAPGVDNAPKFILRVNYYSDDVNTYPFLEFSTDGGSSWNSVSGFTAATIFGIWLGAFHGVVNNLPEGGVAIPGIIRRNGKLYGTFFDAGIDPSTTTEFPLIDPATFNGRI
jgi:hypothetical protein